MRLRFLGIGLVLISSACGTADDVKKTGIVWQGAVNARYDQLARCLSTQTTLYYKATLQFDRNEQRATLTFAVPVTNIPVEVYSLRQTSPDTTEISWSTRLERGQKATKPLYLIELCGAALLPAAPAQAPAPAYAPAQEPAGAPADPPPPAAPVWAPE